MRFASSVMTLSCPGFWPLAARFQHVTHTGERAQLPGADQVLAAPGCTCCHSAKRMAGRQKKAKRAALSGRPVMVTAIEA
jgi:hypothetical protein